MSDNPKLAKYNIKIPVPSRMLIGNGWVDASSGAVREVIDPATAQGVAEVAEGGQADAQRAIHAARQAFDNGPWPKTPAREKARVLHRIADLIEKHIDDLATIETLDTGKTLTESNADMQDIASVFRYYASLIAVHGGDVNPAPAQAISMTVHEPVGVCAMITPWNYPLLQASWKIAPALAAGCTCVIKPSELTPLTTLALGSLMLEAGLPEGTLNIVLGPGASVGAELSLHPDVDLVSFTGGGATGRKVMTAASDTFKRVALELGGKNPNIVFGDAPWEAAIDNALNAVFFHAGQVCSAGSRLLVERRVHDDLVGAVLERAKRIKVGNGFDPTTEMGPLVSAEHREKVERYIELGQSEGARLCLGGDRPQNPGLARGFFLSPTVFTHVTSTMRIAQEEIFGPVLTIEQFDGEEEALALANGTPYGLAGAVWTSDPAKAMRMSSGLRLGTVWINDYHPYFPEAPWGGYKQSGIGRELGRSGLHEYLEEKHIYFNLDAKAAGWFGREGRHA